MVKRSQKILLIFVMAFLWHRTLISIHWKLNHHQRQQSVCVYYMLGTLTFLARDIRRSLSIIAIDMLQHRNLSFSPRFNCQNRISISNVCIKFNMIRVCTSATSWAAWNPTGDWWRSVCARNVEKRWMWKYFSIGRLFFF